MKINLTSSWHISHKAWHKPIWLGWLLVLQYRKSNSFSTLLLSTFLSSAYPRSDLVKNLAIFFRQWNMSTKNINLINVILPHHSICSKIKCEVIHFSQSKSIAVFFFYHIIIFFWIFLSLIFFFFFQYFSFEVIPFHLLLYHLRNILFSLSWILSYFSAFLCVLTIHPCSPLNLNLFRLLH